jgi:crotonobetainyl-CoA:carnitine CoA-transferase CaiB-like acyl-CoA transferase
MAPGTAAAVQQTEEQFLAKFAKAGLATIEINRLKTIWRNQQMMAQLGVVEAASAVNKSL